jgi:hypothetical protein
MVELQHQFSNATNSFVSVVNNCDYVPHQKLKPFLRKLLDMAEIFSEECLSVQENLLIEILSNLLKNESKFTGTDGKTFILSLLKVIDLLFQQLLNQIESIRKLEKEKRLFLAEINKLNAIIDSMRGADVENIGDDFQAICANSNYITHYAAHHRDFSSIVLVVLWKSPIPGPSICHKEMPVLYVHHNGPSIGFSSWSEIQHKQPQEDREFSSEELDRYNIVVDTIERNRQHLFENHSNLAAIRVSSQMNELFIEFVVLCKNFVPVTDSHELPRELDGISTKVCSGWIELCGRPEQKLQRPLRPGAGFAVGEDAYLNINIPLEAYVPCVLGTIGGWYVVDGNTYGVTCAHCIKNSENQLHPVGSIVYQPSAKGLIIDAASKYSGILKGYASLKNLRGNQKAMEWLFNQIADNEEFDAKLPDEAACGKVVGGILGSLNDSGTNVDVAVLKLETATEALCETSFALPGLNSPPLQLGENATNILREFPKKQFHVYGRGARSADTMVATANPLDNKIWFRAVCPEDLKIFVFNCFHAETSENWAPGDSGTWCWTEDGMLIGMGMAYAHIDRKHYCCMLPMEDVEAAINQILNG